MQYFNFVKIFGLSLIFGTLLVDANPTPQIFNGLLGGENSQQTSGGGIDGLLGGLPLGNDFGSILGFNSDEDNDQDFGDESSEDGFNLLRRDIRVDPVDSEMVHLMTKN
uniref:Secreted protein n=1 Tax=Phakopsora pachyrhizi TaxID=170000 RepID=A0A0S1MJ56_PHAPC